MADLNIFTPYASTAIVTGAANVTTALPGPGGVVRLFNNSTFAAFVKFGDSTVVATANDTGMPAGSVESFSVAPSSFAVGGNMLNNPNKQFIAVISPGGVGSLQVTTGEGV